MGRLRKGELPPLTMLYTICKVCQELKDDALFKYQKGRRAGLVCRTCDLEIKRGRYRDSEEERERIKARSRAWSKDNTESSKARSKNYRLTHAEELKIKKVAYHKVNADKINVKSRLWYESNKHNPAYKVGRREYNFRNASGISIVQAMYYLANLENFKRRNKQWRQENKQLALFYTRQYNMNREKRTPFWADTDKIKEVYLNCPKGYHVDHIIPLHGKIVSGLHVYNNLQYLTKEENSRKGNKFSQ